MLRKLLITAGAFATGAAVAADPTAASKPDAAKCPVIAVTALPTAERMTAAGGLSNRDWWPNQLNLKILAQNSAKADPMDPDFNYAEAFQTLDLAAVKKDIRTLLLTSQDWWPADYGNYGPQMIRMAWHSAGTYRVTDGRGGAGYGTQRFAPLNSWPDNVNIDKSRRLLWPIKQKYGKKLSWADLMVLTGNVSLETMGFKTFGFAGGREDLWEPQEDIFWGPETVWLGDKRFHNGELQKPLGATQMGLIYVNPEGPGGKGSPAEAVNHIREAFGRMAMDDEETVALIAGGHTFGKAHGAAPESNKGPEPEAAPIEAMGLGWLSKFKSGKGADTISSGLEGAWTRTPAQWSHDYFDHLFKYEWVETKSPAGARQWVPKDGGGKDIVPDAHRPGVKHQPIMFTTDLALKTDPAYAKISKRFHENPKEFEEAFAKAWYKLTHRDMGPVSRLLGPEVAKPQLWQDPVPAADYKPIDAADVAALKAKLLNSGLSVSQLVSTAWASASSFRGTDNRGGANGARLRLAPMKDWPVNNPASLEKVLAVLEKVQQDFNATAKDGKKVSLADVIVLGGCVGVEKAAKAAGHDITVPFAAGRTDATQEMTDVPSVAYLEPTSDGFRNFFAKQNDRPAEEQLVDRAHRLTLTAPEMTVLVGGLRVLKTNTGYPELGLFTKRPEALTNDFFVNLLDGSTDWKKSPMCEYFFEGRDAKTGAVKWTASRVDLIFGSNSQLRAIAEVYASDDGKEKFVKDFVAAWTKVMNLDRFDLSKAARIGAKAVANK